MQSLPSAPSCGTLRPALYPKFFHLAIEHAGKESVATLWRPPAVTV